MYYTLKDHQGSLAATVHGNTVERLSYDAWGNLRNPGTWASHTAGDTYDGPMFDRGFTGHEHLTAFGLINMNGRMYDPVVSSFLSPDRFVQNPLTAMGFNRYAYCLNNPLRYVDPTGWKAGPGGGHGPDIPPPYVVIDGWASGYLINEVTVTSSYYEEFEYTPYYCTGGGSDATPPWNDSGNGQSVGSNNSSGCGGGSGSHGGTTTSQTPIAPIYNVDWVAQSIKATNETNSYLTSANTIINKGSEFAISGIPHVGPILSIGLTAFDIGGGFDNNLYKTENWWK